MAKKQHSREKLDILADIIRLCAEKTRKTRVIYGTNLSSLQADMYLQELVEQRLIEKVTLDGSSYYQATSRGGVFVEMYSDLKRLLNFDPHTETKEIHPHRIHR